MVGGKSSDEAGVGLGGGGGAVFFVLSAGVGSRDWIIGLVGGVSGEGVFADDVGVRRLLAGDVFDLDNAGEGFIIGVVHLQGWLPVAGFTTDGFAIGGGELRGGKGFYFKLKAAIGKVAVAVVKVGVDGPGIYSVPRLVVVPGGEKIGIEMDFQSGRSFHHPLKKPGEAIRGQRLEFFTQIMIITRGPHGDAGADRRIEVSGMAIPLLQGVAFEKKFVEGRADIGEDYFLAICRVFAGDAFLGQPRGEFSLGGRLADELFVGAEVDRKGPIAAMGVALDAVVGRLPCGEPAQVVTDRPRVGPEIVRAITVIEHSIFVRSIVGIAAQVIASFQDNALQTGLRKALSDDQSRKSRAGDENINNGSRLHES